MLWNGSFWVLEYIYEVRGGLVKKIRCYTSERSLFVFNFFFFGTNRQIYRQINHLGLIKQSCWVSYFNSVGVIKMTFMNCASELIGEGKQEWGRVCEKMFVP